MAKIIRLTPECLEDIKKEFSEALEKVKLSDGKVTFSKTFGTVDRKATVYFKEIAWVKMQALVQTVDKEVGWHGVAFRGSDPEKDEYIISDILVYPQEVTGATVNTDQEEYQTWLMGHDDEVFNNIRMQGHSHVNMATSPSSVDLVLYEKFLSQLEDDMFYIFMIWNKRGEKTIKIYDMAKNVLFETGDCAVKILEYGDSVEKFLEDAKKMVREKVYSTIGSDSCTISVQSYSGAGNTVSYKYDYDKKDYVKTANEDKRDNAVAVRGNQEPKARMGKMKKEGKKSYPYGSGGSHYPFYDEDFYDKYQNYR